MIESGVKVDRSTNTSGSMYEVVSNCLNCSLELRNKDFLEPLAKEKMDESHSQILHPKQLCGSEQPIVNVCISPTCQRHPLYCSTLSCERCLDNHSGCLAIPFNVLTKQIAQRKEEHESFMRRMREV